MKHRYSGYLKKIKTDMKLFSTTILAALCVIPGLAVSGDFYSPKAPVCAQTGYIFGYGGFHFDYDVDGHEPIFPSNEQIEMDAGYIVGAGAGVYSNFLGGSRFEFEGLSAKNDIGRIRSDIFDGRGFIDYGFRGDFATKALMTNVLKEIPVGGFTGYIGAGIGFSDNEINLHNPWNFVMTESDIALAYQFIAGVDVPVARNLDLFMQYKLLGVGETEFQRLDFVVDSHFTHNLVFGARLSF